MNEFLRSFVMKTLLKMIDNNVKEWEVREFALGWFSKGVLTEEDLQEIDERYKQPEPVEETVEETVDTVDDTVEETENFEETEEVTEEE